MYIYSINHAHTIGSKLVGWFPCVWAWCHILRILKLL